MTERRRCSFALVNHVHSSAVDTPVVKGRCVTDDGIILDPREEAATCRRRALAWVGKPEAILLLRAAREFERLAEEEFLRKNHAPRGRR